LESISFLITGTSLVRAGLMVNGMAPSTIAAGAMHMGGRPPGHVGSGPPGHMGGGPPGHMGSRPPGHMGGGPPGYRNGPRPWGDWADP
jgi:hypothetical protein